MSRPALCVCVCAATTVAGCRPRLGDRVLVGNQVQLGHKHAQAYLFHTATLSATVAEVAQVRQAFQDSLAELRATGRSYLAPPKAPQFGVGHSNGALLHLLINSYEPGATDANAIISYNNL